jgi:N-acetylglucosamine-1-phosphodiester alpha-N-acetylglucosaminidase
MHVIIKIAMLVLCTLAHCNGQYKSDYVELKSNSDSAEWLRIGSLAELRFANTTVHFARAPRGGQSFSVGGLCNNRTASTCSSSATSQCAYATNAGFFNVQSGQCIGSVVQRGQIVQLSGSSTPAATFGVVGDAMVLGYVNDSDVQSMRFDELVQGRGVLVWRGESAVARSAQLEGLSAHFVDELAPRVAVGVDVDGALVLVVADGVEQQDVGMSLDAFAQQLIDAPLSLRYAVNLDGGGSATTCLNSMLLNKATCDDTGRLCERPVTTIACIKTPR